MLEQSVSIALHNNSNKTGISINDNKDEIKSEKGPSSTQIETLKDLEELPNEEMNTKTEMINNNQRTSKKNKTIGDEEKETNNFSEKTMISSNVSTSSASSESQNILNNINLMNFFINSQQNPLFLNIFSNLKNASNLGQLYPNIKSSNDANDKNMNEGSSKNIEVVKTKLSANSENQNEISSVGDSVFKRKKNEPIQSNNEFLFKGDLAKSQATNSDNDLVGKNAYKSKIKSHRHHHHHHSHNSTDVNSQRGMHRQRENSKKTDIENTNNGNQNLNTSISSSFTSTSSVSGLTGASSSLSSSPSSSSPSLTSSSSMTSSEPSSPSISPNLDTQVNMSNLDSIKEAAFTNNVNTKLRKLTKSNTLQNGTDSFQESFDSTNSELQNLMRFNNNKQFSQSMSVPKLSMPFALLGASSSCTAPTTPTLINSNNFNKKKTTNTSINTSNNEYFNFGSNSSLIPSHSSMPSTVNSLSISNIAGGSLIPKNSNTANATPSASTNPTASSSSIPSSSGNSNGVSSEVKQILKNHLLRKLDKQNNNPASKGGPHALSHPLTHSLSQLPDITNQKPSASSFINEVSIGTPKYSSAQHQQQIQSKNNHQSNQQRNPLQQNPQQQQLHPYLLNLFSAQQQQQQHISALSKPVELSSTKKNYQLNCNKLTIDELIDENNLRRTTSEPNLKVKSALKDRLLEKRNLLNPFTQNKRENRQNISTSQQNQHSLQTHGQHNRPQHSPSSSNSSNKKYLDLNAKSSSLVQQPSHGSSLASQSNSIINHPLSGSLSKLYENNNPSGSSNASNYNHLNFLQQQKLQHDASLIAAVANAVANSSSSVEIATALKVALQEQFSRVSAFNSNTNSSSQSILDPTTMALNQALHYNQYFGNNNEKMQSSISFPTLPSTIHNNNSPNHSFETHHIQNNYYHHHLSHSSGKTKKEDEYTDTIKKMPKFGHTAHVEEDSELLLENELKDAAQQNEAKTSFIYENQRHVTEMNMDEEDEEEIQVEEVQRENNRADDEELEAASNAATSFKHIKRLERANSHYTYKQFANNFNRHSQQLYQHLPPSYSSFMNSNSNCNASTSSYDRFIQLKQQQNKTGSIQQQRGVDHSILRQNQFDPHNQLVKIHQQELEELKMKQLQFHNGSKSSFFSDPHLLKSLRIANSNSNANLDIATKNFSPNFVTTNDKNRIIFSKNNQADVSKISLSMLPISSSKDADLILKKPCLLNNESKMDLDTDNSSDSKIYRYTTGIAYDKIMLKHECTCGNQSNHLETPNRIKSIWNRFKANNIHEECEIVNSKLATISDLLTCHNEQYSLIFGSELESRPRLPPEYLQNYMMNVTLASCQGFALTYDQDNSWNEEFTPIACRVAVGSTYELASLVTAGKLKNGFALVRPPGSHAEYNKPLGFCYFNTVAIVAKMLKRNLSLDRILIVDWDVHHGNGTQQMTYTDPNIMYISLHRHDNATFFPGTGSIYECGQDNGLGKNVNIAWNGKLNPPMSDAEYLAAFRCVVMPIAQAFRPQIVLVSCGFDGTENHPKELGGYKLSPMCFAYMTKKLMSLAEGKVVLVLEGGYDINSLCDCSEMCINALLDKQIPSFPNETLEVLPNNSAILDLENVIEVQRKYWPNLRNYRQYIRMSQNQFIGIFND